MTFKEALKKAKDNGYETPYHYEPACIQEQVLLDPKFFQSLGKAMGWSKVICKNCNGQSPISCSCPYGIKNRQVAWLYHQHRLIDHLASGKDIESFFAELK